MQLTTSVAPAPGISIAVVHRGDTVAMKGYGFANVEDSVPATDRTVFGIASVTKQFTATAIMALVEDGSLRLDASLGQMLPWYTGPAKVVTLEQLLNHTSGIPDYLPKWDSYGDRMPLSRDQMLAVLAEPLDFQPGTWYAYSNTGYYVLGLILEAIAWPDSYAQYLARTQWQPLGLGSTQRCSEESIIPHRAQGYLTGSRGLYNAPPYFPNTIGSDGSLCSTVRDLVIWARALAEGKVVSERSYNRMTTWTDVAGRKIRSGFGLRMWQLDDEHPFVWHTGANLRFSAVLAHYPNDDLTIAMLANGGINLLPLQEQIARVVLDLPIRFENP